MINTNKIINNIIGRTNRKVKQLNILKFDKKRFEKDLEYIKNKDDAYEILDQKYNFVKKVLPPWNKIMRVGSIVDIEGDYTTLLGNVINGKVKIIGTSKHWQINTLLALTDDGDIVEFGLDESMKPSLTEEYKVIKY